MDDVADRIEHTVLGPLTTPDDVRAVLDDATDLGMRACIPPCYLEEAVEYAPDVDVTTVVGFPHGQHVTDAKAEEARTAWEAGAAEIDVVANAGLVRAGEDDRYRRDVAEVVAAVPIPVKVIVAAPSLTDEELRRAGEHVAEAGADFLKTATGFGDGGATVADVRTLADYRPVKASGGIGSWERAKAMFDAGATRIGASAGATIVEEYRQA